MLSIIQSLLGISASGASSLLLVGLACYWPLLANSESYVLPPIDIDLIGEASTVLAREEDTLLDIARRFDVGQNEILLANKAIDRWKPAPGSEVIIPTRYILPDVKRSGVVLNVAELRMYYFPAASQQQQVQSFPVSIGRMDWSTPMGVTKVTQKIEKPNWYPPESVRIEAKAEGIRLPGVIPPGPDNPLGEHAIKLDIPGYLIHGTNRPFGVGMRVTHGCVRMYPEDIAQLFGEIPLGTEVTIVNQPIKVGWSSNFFFVEVHPSLEESVLEGSEIETAMRLLNEQWEYRRFVVDVAALKAAIDQKTGIPVMIGRAAVDLFQAENEAAKPLTK